MIKTSKNTESVSFVQALRRALAKSWESGLNGNRKVYANLKNTGNKQYQLILSHAYGCGGNDISDRVKFASLTINMKITADHNVILSLPNLYHCLDKYYQNHHSTRVTPLVEATQLLDFLTMKTNALNSGKAKLPGKHYQPKFSTSCDQFKLVSRGVDVDIKPLGHGFNFSTECALKRGYLINDISELLNYASYLYISEKNYFDEQERLDLAVKSINA